MNTENRAPAAWLRRALQTSCALLPFFCFQAKAESLPMLEVGTTTPCSTWTWARGHQPAASDLQDWALGYFSGEEMGVSASFLIGSSDNSLFSELDTQCRIEPRMRITEAVDTLVARIKDGP